MKRRFDKKRFWIIIAVLAIIEIVVFGVVKMRCPSKEVSDLYSRYENEDGVGVSFVKGYKVNDTVRVDVTLLEAKTDSAWTVLTENFNIVPPPKEVNDIIDESFVDISLISKKTHAWPMDTTLSNNEVLAVLWSDYKISVFSAENEEQLTAVLHHLCKESINQSKNNNHYEEND